MTISKENLIEFLEKQIKEIDTLSTQGRNAHGFTTWCTATARILEQVYGSKSSHHTSFNSINYRPTSYFQPYISVLKSDEQLEKEFDALNKQPIEKAYQDGLSKAKELLQGILKEVQSFEIFKKEEVTQKESPQTFNITQTQSVNITIENVLQNTLTAAQHKELKTILAEKDTEKKSNKLVEFLKRIGIPVLVEIIKGLLIPCP